MSPFVYCVVCERPATVRALCKRCARALQVERLVPEQIESRVELPVKAALVDAFGRVHRLGVRSLVGREVPGDGVTIRSGLISRHHATVKCDTGSGRFLVIDLASENGTYVDGERIAQPTRVDSGKRVDFGSVAFYFVELALEERASHVGVSGETWDLSLRHQSAGPPKLRLLALGHQYGGLARLGSREVTLTGQQFQLLNALADRLESTHGDSPLVRGFMASSELLAEIDWETQYPSEKHLQQLVRRIRASLSRAGCEDIIESRRGLGYRLRVEVERAD